jgi:hypothetical protein
LKNTCLSISWTALLKAASRFLLILLSLEALYLLLLARDLTIMLSELSGLIFLLLVSLLELVAN